MLILTTYFEVRGTKRAKKGEKFPVESEDYKIKLTYKGLDNKERTTHILMCPQPDKLKGGFASYDIKLNPNQSYLIALTIAFLISGEKDKRIAWSSSGNQKI